MADSVNYQLVQDKRGMVWDLLLYVPTVIALFSIGAQLWYSADQTWAYPLMFMGTFFFLIGSNRILGSRLMLLPGSVKALTVDKQQITLQLNKGRLDLVKDVRYFPDYAGKTFGLTGMDGVGRKKQWVLHRGQFETLAEFNDIRTRLAVYK